MRPQRHPLRLRSRLPSDFACPLSYSPAVVRLDVRSERLAARCFSRVLEADAVVILKPELMDRQHLYVAMTRCSRTLVICSGTATLSPE
jgi:hypothetical protein